MASNEDHVTRIEQDDRRYFVLNAGNASKGDKAYFGKIADDLKAGGYQNLLHFFRAYDLSDFDMRTPPRTEAKNEQAGMSATAEQSWWINHLMWGTDSDWPEYVDKIKLLESCHTFADSLHRGSRKMSPQQFRLFLATVSGLPAGMNVPVHQRLKTFEDIGSGGFLEETKKMRWCWKLLPREELREIWNRDFPMLAQNWPEPQLEILL
jgi:hypothetical protein